ncbi:hypothetical protein RJ639_032375 [Escallonia herrerae]|uniref:Peptidase C1A papain C-terminal domain-containing protein n=1 Tax=Escallonia herrerae TaxID=1293975 RepID=A0AA88WSY9_9ASTE|nr:hypothetical protein RJ639_032375 [Escallonia herrerae]
MPPTMDWRKKGAVTPVKDQGQVLLSIFGCGSHGRDYAAKNGSVDLSSEQELVDCDTCGEDKGCEVGIMDNAFDFIQQNHGISTEANYPYQCFSDKEGKSGPQIQAMFH